MDEDDMLSFKMPFGKHEGKEIGDLPVDYLKWLLVDADTKGRLREIVNHFEEEIMDAAEFFYNDEDKPKLRDCI